MPITVRQRTMQGKNGGKRSANKRKSIFGDYMVTSAPSDLPGISYPGGMLAWGLLMATRLPSVLWNHIGDCDETYNYWEPLHYLVYGSGFQTWEYSPQFALRSYAALWVFAGPAKLLSYVMTPYAVFYALRLLLAVATSYAELMFYKAVCQEFGVHVGRVWLLAAAPAAGLFASSTAMLPSAWSHALCTAALASWWKRRYPAAVLMVAASAILSWPFTALIGVPIAFDMLFLKRDHLQFFKWSALGLLVFLPPVVIIDSIQYGRLVVAPWNIVKYNVFSGHGPNLYGVEPWTYYFVNGFLNFNIVWVFAILCPVTYAVCTLLAPRSTVRASFCSPMGLNLMPLALWLLVFMLQPHKEERFLYPVYSMIVLAGSISLDCALKIVYAVGNELFKFSHEKRHRHYLSYTSDFLACILLGAFILSVSRVVQQYNNHHGAMAVLRRLPHTEHSSYVCYGKDWYRAPSSFHVGGAYRLRFVQSEFAGQMPAPYDEENDTRAVHPYFNDLNQGDSRTYLKPTQCHYLVHSDIGAPSALEPAHHEDKRWDVVAAVPIVDSAKSHRLFRAFYVPFLSNKYVVYANLYLLRNKKLTS